MIAVLTAPWIAVIAGVLVVLLGLLVAVVVRHRLFSRRLTALFAAPKAILADPLSQGEFTYEQLNAAGALMFQGELWRQRSVRKVEFLSPNVIRARISLDFETPPTGKGGLSRCDLLIPLFLAEKVKLADIDLRDESETAIPILNRSDEARFVTLLLFSFWEQLFPSTPIDPDSDIAKVLYRVVKEDPSTAELAYFLLLALLVELRMKAPGMPTRGYNIEDNFKSFATAVHYFIRGAYLFAWLSDAEVGERRILKLALETDAQWQLQSVWSIAENWDRRIQNPIDKDVRKFLEASELDDKSIRYILVGSGFDSKARTIYSIEEPGALHGLIRDVLAMGRGLLSRVGIVSRKYGGTFSPFVSRSEHLEIEAPPGTYFTGGRLRSCERGQWSETDVIRRGVKRAHLMSSLSSNSSAGLANDLRVFEIRLRASRRGWLLAAFAIALVITMLLLFVWERREDLAGSTAATLIGIALGIGAASVAYLVRPGEHTMTTRLLEGPRIAVALTGLAALIAIALLAFPTASPNRKGHFGWGFTSDGWVPLVIAAVGLAILVGNYLGGAIGWTIGFRHRLRGNSLPKN
jgi:hypothetical protein